MQGWHNRGYDGTPSVEANMRAFGYLPQAVFRGDSYITAIWTAKVTSETADMGQFHLTVQAGDTAELHWDEKLQIACTDDCLFPSPQLIIGANEVYTVTIRYSHLPSAKAPGFALNWTGNSDILANSYSCAYPVSQKTPVFLLSGLQPSLSNSNLAYFDSTANKYVNSDIELKAGGTYTFVLLLKDNISNIRFDYVQNTFTWTSSIANESGNTAFDSLSGTHHILYSPKAAGRGSLSVESAIQVPVSVVPGSGKDYTVSPAKSSVAGPGSCQVSQVCSYTISLQDEWGNEVNNVDISQLYAALLANGRRKQLSITSTANSRPEIAVMGTSEGSFQLEVLYLASPLANSRLVTYSFIL